MIRLYHKLTSNSHALQLLVLLIVAAMIAFAGIMLFMSRPEPAIITINPPLPTATNAPTATPSPILVYVTGAVQQPELTFELPFGSRVADAIAAAGGFTDQANKTLVNLAGILRDGDQVHVPALTDGGAVELPTPSGGAKVFVNQATLEELQALPGVGPALAERIVNYREGVGRFAVLADLDNVPGIGEATLEKWRDLIVFD